MIQSVAGFRKISSKLPAVSSRPKKGVREYGNIYIIFCGPQMLEQVRPHILSSKSAASTFRSWMFEREIIGNQRPAVERRWLMMCSSK